MMHSAQCVKHVSLRLATAAVLIWGVASARVAQASPTSSDSVAPPAEDIFHDGFDPPPPPPPNDTCVSATTLTVNAIPVTGTTVGATNDYDSGLETCTGFSQAGPDVAYQVTLGASAPVTITLSAPYPTFDPSISLIGPGSASVCNAVPVTCLKGADQNGFGSGESFQFTPSTTGTYYIIVDSFYGAGSAGSFAIGVSSP